MLKKLGELKKEERGKILKTCCLQANSKIARRLLEMGFLKGSEVEIKHDAPFGDLIVVAIRGGFIALRRKEANLVEVEVYE